MSENAEDDGQRDLVRRLLTARPFDQRDHLVEEALTRLGRDLDHDVVGEDTSAASHARMIAARLPDHGSTLAGDCRLVDPGHALDDLSVGRDDLPCLDQHEITGAEFCRGDQLADVAGKVVKTKGRSIGSGRAKTIGLGFAPRFGKRRGEVCEQDGEEQEDR